MKSKHTMTKEHVAQLVRATGMSVGELYLAGARIGARVIINHATKRVEFEAGGGVWGTSEGALHSAVLALFS